MGSGVAVDGRLYNYRIFIRAGSHGAGERSGEALVTPVRLALCDRCF